MKTKTTQPTFKAITVIVLLTLIFGFITAKEIHSTKEGGNWCESTTWQSGEIPGNNDNVTIIGQVLVNCPAFADTLLVKPNGLLIISETDSLQAHCIILEEENEVKGKIQNKGLIIVDEKPEFKKEEEY